MLNIKFNWQYLPGSVSNLGNTYLWVIWSLLNIDAITVLMFYYTNALNSNGPQYIKNFFQTRHTKYNLRSRGINLEQPGYNNRFFHNSFTYIVSRLWNKLPAHIKTSSKFSDFTRNLKAFDFSKLGPSCHCNSCI